MADLRDYGLAAVDVETTGLSPRYHHRIVEIGVVLFRIDGTIEDEYESLVNPHRDLSGTESIHGLSMLDLVEAPGFEDIAADVGARLRDRVLVAHNARFDVTFLQSEFERSGLRTPEPPYLCTMQLAGSAEHGRRLADVCRTLSVMHGPEHTAIGDARAAAAILSRWYDARPAPKPTLSDCGSSEPQPSAWPVFTPGGVALVRGEASRRASAERSYLSRLIDRLPTDSHGTAAGEAAYLDLLERALDDRHLSAEEVMELAWLAGVEHLGAADLRRLHVRFFDALRAAAWEDGIITQLEEEDLRLVADFLSIDSAYLEEALLHPPAAEAASWGLSHATLPAGTTVCFTGTLRATIDGSPISRERAEELATARGLTVRPSVTKKLDVLVVADSQSQSAKAQKARSYGTRILAESAFWQMIGVVTD